MQTLESLNENEMYHQFSHQGICIESGPFNLQLKSDNQHFCQLFRSIYGQSPLLNHDSIFHYRVTISSPKNYRRWLKPQIDFEIDSIKPFEPYPVNQGLPLFEWGLNWCIGTTAHQYLILHSAVLEKNAKGFIFPALPGSGKSTLCAGLAYNGYRLLSDEFGIIRHSDTKLLPSPRAIGLKNESISFIKEFIPDAWMGPEFHGTRKGTVAHLAPPAESIIRQKDTVTPAFIIFPKYIKGAESQLKPINKTAAFTRLSNNAFNYQISMENGFLSLSHLIKSCEIFEFTYSDLSDAIKIMDSLSC